MLLAPCSLLLNNMITEDTIRKVLAQVNYPGFSRDIVSFGLVKKISIDGDDVRVDLSIATRDPAVPEEIYKTARVALDGVAGIGKIDLQIEVKEPPQPAEQQGGTAEKLGQSRLPGIKKVIAVASGKGGVGKSTVAANLAISLAQSGAAVGLCDCDLYGPSVALMFGSSEQPMADSENNIMAIEAHGIKLMSMGFLLGDDSPAIVRGPIATRYTQQFLRQVAWGELDYLILDLPPGTGDIQLTIVQTVAVDGAVIVTTPQEMALIDARKAMAMFQKVNVPITGIIENMSWFDSPSDGERYHIFGKGGGASEAEKLGIPLLGQIPIDIDTRERGDRGEPVALAPRDDNPISASFHDIAGKVAETLA